MKKLRTKQPTCHPERPHKARGLCGSCYDRIVYYPKHKKQINERNKTWYENNAQRWIDYTYKHRLLKQYGISVEEYNILYTNQQGRCAICNTHQSQFKLRLAVDHNHQTGVVRGLLCQNCNTLIGMAKEDVKILENTIKYLTIHA